MRTIYKYSLKEDNYFEIPKGGKILTLQIQNKSPCLWIEVDNENDTTETREFFVVGTGQIIPNNATYIGTFQEPPFVWHVYELM